MSGIGVILNPNSKKFKRNPSKLDQMSFIIGDKASCKPTHDLDDLYRVADEFKSRDIDVLAISGGDGTIHCTLTTFINVYGEKPLPKVTLLRGGTMNIIASTFGIKGSTEELMSSLLMKYHEDKEATEKKLRLMKINGAYGCIFGIGVAFKFMQEYYSNPKLNAFIAAKTLVQVLSSGAIDGKTSQRLCQRFDAEVIVDGKKLPFANYNAVFAGSIRQLGLDFNAFHHMLHQNENFHTIAMNVSPKELLPHIKKIYDGEPLPIPELMNEQAKKMTIQCQEPMGYTIDGDMLGPVKEFTVEAGPEITVLV
ncbi:MAG: hypothetical protein H7A33_07525 [Deltaproteobacteria bacterium]|nr:hypothetical protein [Deltaproteobacteria bacterium]